MKICFARFTTIICLLAPPAGFAQSATLLTTITNPVPAANESFGRAVAAVGNDRVLVGGLGAAYLLSPSGTLANNWKNP